MEGEEPAGECKHKNALKVAAVTEKQLSSFTRNLVFYSKIVSVTELTLSGSTKQIKLINIELCIN